jgi:hypothetical protein
MVPLLLKPLVHLLAYQRGQRGVVAWCHPSVPTGDLGHWRYFAEISGFARLRPSGTGNSGLSLDSAVQAAIFTELPREMATARQLDNHLLEEHVPLKDPIQLPFSGLVGDLQKPQPL